LNFGRVTTLNKKPEVVLRHRGYHLEIKYYVIITQSRMARSGRLWRNFGNLMQITVIGAKSQMEEEFQYGGRLFLPHRQ